MVKIGLQLKAFLENVTGLAADGDDAARARVVADYIAGMTDRYAFAEHKRISG